MEKTKQDNHKMHPKIILGWELLTVLKKPKSLYFFVSAEIGVDINIKKHWKKHDF